MTSIVRLFAAGNASTHRKRPARGIEVIADQQSLADPSSIIGQPSSSDPERGQAAPHSRGIRDVTVLLNSRIPRSTCTGRFNGFTCGADFTGAAAVVRRHRKRPGRHSGSPLRSPAPLRQYDSVNISGLLRAERPWRTSRGTAAASRFERVRRSHRRNPVETQKSHPL